MNLFIANVTEQPHVFNWREPENPQLKHIDIPAGSQVQVLRDKPKEVVDHVISHHKAYGLVNEKEAIKLKKEQGKLHLIYSTDQPLPLHAYELGQEHNEAAVQYETDYGTEKTAYSIVKSLEQNPALSEGLKEIQVEIIEEKPRGEIGGSKKQRVAKTFKHELVR